MRALSAVALNTFREAIRNRVFASLILFGLAMMMLTLAVSSASLHEEVRLMKDVGLFLVSTFSVLISIFVGVNLLYKEIERKTIYTVLPKPIHRWAFLLGKYLGLAGVMLVQVALMGGTLALQFLMIDAQFGLEMVQALLLIYVEVLVVMSLAMLFSSFSTPFLSGLLTFGMFAVGRFVNELLNLKLVVGKEEMTPTLELIRVSVRRIVQLAPDLSQFNTTAYVVYEETLSWSMIGHAVSYGLTYAAAVLLIAAVIFSRRDLT